MASTDLIFDRAPLTGSPVGLVFGEDGDAPDLPDAHVSGSITFVRPSPSGLVRPSVQIAGPIAFVRPTMSGAVRYFTDTSRPTVGKTESRWQDGTDTKTFLSNGWEDTTHTPSIKHARWQEATHLSVTGAAIFQDALRISDDIGVRFQDGIGLGTQASSAFEDGVRTRLSTSNRFQDGIGIQNGANQQFQDGDRSPRRHVADRFQDAVPSSAYLSTTEGYARFLARLFGSRYQEAMRPPAGISIGPGPQPGEPCYIPSPHLLFEHLWIAGDTNLVFICEAHTPPGPGPDPEPPAQIVVPIRKVYLVINDIQIKRVDGNIPLPTYTLQLSLDADSWTWSWSATLHKSALPNLQPAQIGVPVEIEALINGVPYRLLVESVRRNREFAQTRLEVTGRGIAAALDAPYALVTTHANGTARTALQLMEDALTINGVPIGWSIDWQLTDWLVPAGAWIYEGTYIDAINQIAQAAGGYVQPHATSKTLRILPRYPSVPWSWSSVSPDIEMPIDPVSVEGVEWISKPDYTRVFVSGEGQGVLGQVTRTGTAGDVVAPMVTDPLITHVDAARQRGISILSDTGPQATVSLRLPVLPETGIIVPGQFVRRTDGAEVLQGLVRSMSLNWDAPTLRQTIEVQTHG